MRRFVMMSASVLACALVSTPSADAAVRFVRATAAGANNGTSWANAFTTLGAGLTAAVAGDELWVAAGTYRPATPATPNPRTVSFQLKTGVQVLGGFAGTETLLSQRNVRLNVCVLSGDISANDTPNFGNRADNSFRVVEANGVTATGILDGFVIRGGQADGAPPDNVGAALRLSSSSAGVRNCIIRDNFADRGAVQCLGSPAQFANVVITGNRGNSVAAFDAQSGNAPTLICCSIVANTSLGTNNVLFLNCTGGTVLGCVLWGNVANSASLQDAQIDSFNSPTLNVGTCDVEGGTVGLGGSNFTSDPLFVSMLGIDAVAGSGDEDLRLKPGSPCIDRANNVVLPGDVTDMDGDGNTGEGMPFDLSWRNRFHDDPSTGGPAGQLVDVGAYEFQGTSCIGDIDGNGLVNTADLTRFLAVFGNAGAPLIIGDFNGDGLVNTADLVAFLAHFGQPCPM